jgi:predicted O-methyltransferase YrrM
VHALRQLAPPRAVTAIERDPLIVRVARRWFGLRAVRGLRVIRGEAHAVVSRLIASRRLFDLVVEDATYADTGGHSAALQRGLLRLVSAGGALVVNRHFRRPALLLATEMAPFFRDVSVRRIRRDGENVVVRGVGRRRKRPGRRA